jgi:hypothetical protein
MASKDDELFSNNTIDQGKKLPSIITGKRDEMLKPGSKTTCLPILKSDDEEMIHPSNKAGENSSSTDCSSIIHKTVVLGIYCYG